METQNRERTAVVNLAPGKPEMVDPVVNLLSYVVLFLGLATIAVTGILVVRSYSGMPTADQWAPIEWLATHNGIAGWNFLWAQHNEHRLVIPNIFYLVDIYVFHAQSIFLLVSIFAMQSLHLWLWAVVLAKRFTRPITRAAIGAAAFCLFRPTQIQNFIWGYQVCFMLTILASVAALAALTVGIGREPRTGKIGRDCVVAAIFAGAVASFSSVNGLLVWPLLIAAAIALGQPKSIVAICIGAGAACCTAYFWGYQFTAGAPGQAREIGGAAEYFLYYFGASLHYLRPGKWNAMAAMLVFAVAAVAVVAVLASYVGTVRKGAEPFRVFLASTGLFCIATATMTALGRSQMGVEQAAAGRYQSYAMLFWLCSILLILNRSSEPAAGTRRTLAAGALAIIMVWMVVAAVQVPAFARAIESQKRQEETATLAIAAHAWDPVLADFSPQSFLKENNAQDLEFLRKIGGWIYSEKFYRAWGQPLTATYALAAPSACQGELQEVKPAGGSALNGVRLRGWGWDNEAKARVERVLIVDRDDRVIGVGRGSDHEFPTSEQSSDPRAWFGFASPMERPVFLRAYALAGHPAKACLLAKRP